MNILHYSQAPPLKAGMENVLYYLTKEISKRHKTILQFNYNYRNQLPRISFGRVILRPIFIPDIPKFRAVYKDLAAYANLKKNLNKYKVDILHTHFLVPGALGSFVAKRKGIPSIITEHGMIYFQLNRNIEMRMIRYALKNADKIVCIDYVMHNILLNMCDDKEKFEVITNGVDTKEFRPDYSKRNPKRVIFIGRLVEVKGPDFLFDAIPKVVNEIPDAEFWIVGDGHLKSDLEKRTRKMGIDRNIKFFGWVPMHKIPELINKCSVFVSLQQYDNFPSLSLMESMACGLSIIATDVGHTKRYIGKNSLLVKRGDIDSLADKLIVLLSNYNKSKRLGLISRKIVEKNHTWEIVANKYEKLYEQMIW